MALRGPLPPPAEDMRVVRAETDAHRAHAISTGAEPNNRIR
jgi:hypothetical protein